MTDFVLVPGAGGSAWYWHRVAAGLSRLGHQALPVQLPAGDPDAGLDEYRQRIVAAARTLDGPVVIVAQSLGGFSAPLACEEVAAQRLVLVNAMIPAPGETAGQWWDDVGWLAAAQTSAARDGRPPPDVTDLDNLFFHDLSPELVAAMRADPTAGDEGPTVFDQPWPRTGWPDVPTSIVAGRDDRFFPVALQEQVARDRLGRGVDVLPGGHLLALSQPNALIDYLSSPGG